MAGVAIDRRALEDIVDVAGFAGDFDVLAGQWEGCQRMVKDGRQPACRGMTQTAIPTKLTLMLVVLRVAGVAIGRRALEDIVDVAGFAGNLGVLAFQLEGGQRVVELSRDPAIGRMAHAAIHTEAAFMGVVLQMARKTILRRSLQVCNRTRIHMAL